MMRIKIDVLRSRADAILAALDWLAARRARRRGVLAGWAAARCPARRCRPSRWTCGQQKICPLADFAARLRTGTPPVVGYVSGNRFRLDLRTIFPRQDDMLVQAIRALFSLTIP